MKIHDFLQPENLHFNGKTDEDGRLEIKFPFKPWFFFI